VIYWFVYWASLMTVKCSIRFETTDVELYVTSESPTAWRWSVCLLNGMILEKGIAGGQSSGKASAQRAFEARLTRAGAKTVVSRYDWCSV